MRVARGVLLAASIAALAFAFLAVYALYASLAVAAVGLAFATIAALARRGSRLDLAALAVALMPVGYLLALDLRQLLC